MSRRRPSFPTLAVWIGVTVVLGMSFASLLDLQRAARESEQAGRDGRVSATLRHANRAYEREEHELLAGIRGPASGELDAALHAVVALDPAARPQIDGLLHEHAAYRRSGDLGAAKRFEERIAAANNAASRRALTHGRESRRGLSHVFHFGLVTVAFAILIFAALAVMLRRNRRGLDAARAAELDRLAEIAYSDPLTGLRNQRAFQEDLARDLQRAGRSGAPLALVRVDLDDLKRHNDAHGHQAGDERLRAFADALCATMRGADCAYRTGGDEFAVILPDARAWGALEFTQRLRTALPGFTATAGIAEAETLRPRDELVREADLALLCAQRLHQDAAIYTPDLESVPSDHADEHHTRTLASALARAVDAKDSYTRSHCQTVSQLTALIAAELGFSGPRLARMRLAGLLHDVGKIGIPDAILNKPAALTDEEYAVMQSHSLLGFEIVEAAGLPEEARFVRHHHERVDGRGYPDRLAGDAIPLESRIILVADAFEAMTSDRPYRKAPGREFALAELERGAGSQFDATVVGALCRVLDRESALLAN